MTTNTTVMTEEDRVAAALVQRKLDAHARERAAEGDAITRLCIRMAGALQAELKYPPNLAFEIATGAFEHMVATTVEALPGAVSVPEVAARMAQSPSVAAKMVEDVVAGFRWAHRERDRAEREAGVVRSNSAPRNRDIEVSELVAHERRTLTPDEEKAMQTRDLQRYLEQTAVRSGRSKPE